MATDFNVKEEYQVKLHHLKLLRLSHHALQKTIQSPARLCDKLYSSQLVPEQLKRNIQQGNMLFSTMINGILSSMEKEINEDINVLPQFINILKQDETTRSVALDMERKMKALHRDTEPQSTTDSTEQSQDYTLPPATKRKRRCHMLPDTFSSIVHMFTSEEDDCITPLPPSTPTPDPTPTLKGWNSNTSTAFETVVTSTTIGLGLDSTYFSEEGVEIPPAIKELNELLECDKEEDECECMYIERSLSLIKPNGVLKKRWQHQIYERLFKMAWNGQDNDAMNFVKGMKRNQSVQVDLKVVCMEVIHTVNSERDLKMLLGALAYTDRKECENKHILKCRLHRRIAGLHYRSGDTEEAKDHLITALQLADQITPDIDSIYTMRLQALILFEEYKENPCNPEARRGAEKYFQLAMDHARRQPEWKRLITERIKISKAVFHLDMIQLHQEKEDVNEQLYYRTKETLEDVQESYLTDGDRAFFYTAYARLKLLNPQDLQGAKGYIEPAISINKECGFSKRLAETEEILARINAELCQAHDGTGKITSSHN